MTACLRFCLRLEIHILEVMTLIRFVFLLASHGKLLAHHLSPLSTGISCSKHVLFIKFHELLLNAVFVLVGI